MATKDPAAVAQKWATNAGNAVQSWADGINAVTTAPGQAAARQKNAYVQGVQAKADVWARRVAAVPLADWQSMTTSKGQTRYPQGIQAAQSAMADFMGKFLPAVQQIANNLPPRGTLEQNIQRMVTQVQQTAKFSYK